MTLLEILLLVAAALCFAAGIVSDLREYRRPVTPDDGCCGCGANLGDALVGGENYCWACIDTWPDEAPPVADLGIDVFPGRERGDR